MSIPYGPLSYDGPPPASAAWREGYAVGDRQFVDVGDLVLESGQVIPDVGVAYETWGTLNADASNAIYICHALTGDSHVSGEAGPGHMTAGWWDGLVGPGCPIDTDEWFVACANILGGCQGTTGPASTAPDGQPWGGRFPRITVGDMVEVERRFADAIGVHQWALMLGPSLGGMRVLEWMAATPDRVRVGLVLGTTAAVSADEIATHTIQVDAIKADPRFAEGNFYGAPAGEGPHVGMGLARRVAHLSYRTESELDLRFGRSAQEGEDLGQGGRFAVQSYLDHQADKLARRFDANTYILLTEAMTYFDVGHGRGGTDEVLASITQPLVVVAIDSDRLFPPRLQQHLVDVVPGAEQLHVITSPYGHDGFLVENDQVGAVIRHGLELARVADSR